MGDNDYENVNGWYPILIDGVRDPWKSWWEHRQRGSLGGVDCVANVGTPIYAPANCYVTFTDRNAGGSGGRTVTATYNDGWKDQFMHLEEFAPTSGSKQKGHLLGYTGMSVADGYPRVAQHLHWHRIDPSGSYQDPYGTTNRRNPWSYFVGSGTSGGGTTPIEEDDMYDQTAEQKLLVRLDGIRTVVDDLAAWKKSGADAPKVRVYNRPDGMAAAIDVDEGFRYVFASYTELSNWRRLGLCSESQIPVTDAEFADLLAKADARLIALK